MGYFALGLSHSPMTPKIPKIIHYCWFGHKEKPRLAKRCIASWKYYLPDYHLMEWDESNFDYAKCLFARQAYEAKKFAFVADYARSCVLFEYGGVYMDTDMEVLKNFDDSMLMDEGFAGCEKIGLVSAGIIGSTASNLWIEELCRYYESRSFLEVGSITNLTPLPAILTSISRKFGYIETDCHQYLKCGIHIYPVEYFYPKSFETNRIIISKNTATIHYYAGSWLPLRERIRKFAVPILKNMRIYGFVSKAKEYFCINKYK
jgi:hypothetical protein